MSLEIDPEQIAIDPEAVRSSRRYQRLPVATPRYNLLLGQQSLPRKVRRPLGYGESERQADDILHGLHAQATDEERKRDREANLSQYGPQKGTPGIMEQIQQQRSMPLMSLLDLIQGRR